MAPKRPHSPPAHPAFTDPKADIVVRSSDDYDFPYRRSFLENAAEVFEDAGALAAVQPVEASGEEQRQDGRPVVKLAEEGAVIEAFLLFAHPRLANPQIKTITLFEELCKATTKYDAPGIRLDIFGQAERFRDAAPTLLGLALIHKVPSALPLVVAPFEGGFLKDHVQDPTVRSPYQRSTYAETQTLYEYKRLNCTVMNIPERLREKFSPALWSRLLKTQISMLDPSSREQWKTFAKAIEKDPTLLD